MTTPNPGYDGAPSREVPGYAGVSHGGDATAEPGQYPSSLFGVALPGGTGAPGTAGAAGGPSDPTNEPGQLYEGISGLGPADTADTGAPGSAGASDNPGGPDSVQFTRPGSFLSGSYVQDKVTDSISGTSDWTQANDGSYGSGGPQLPGIKGNEPTGTGAGQGRVLHGGRGPAR